MEPSAPISYLAISLFLLCGAGGIISWCFGVYYMIKATSGVHAEHRWERYRPFSMFMPALFTSEGNAYRVKLLRAGGFFLAFASMGAAVGLVMSFAQWR